MREIKFRAWDTEAKKWLDISYLFLDCDGKVIGYTVEGDTWGIDKVELVEYTGLKDKNGKEIYEGDLIRLKGNAFVNHEVYWDSRAFQFRLCSLNSYIQERQFDKTHLLTLANNGEIIGNIYANPELVAVKP